MELIYLIGILSIVYISIVNIVYFLLTLISFGSIFGIKKRTKFSIEKQLSRSLLTPSVSVLIPVYNNGYKVIESISSVLGQIYSNYEIVVINDGSNDYTLKALLDEYNLKKISTRVIENNLDSKTINGVYHNSKIPRLYVIDKENGGKSDALNLGVNFSKNQLITSINPGDLLDNDALTKIIQLYLENPEVIAAVEGNIKILNGNDVKDSFIKNIKFPKKIISMFQMSEYIKTFVGEKIGFSSLNSLSTTTNDFCLFKKDHLIKVGGYKYESGNGQNLILKIHKYLTEVKEKYKIIFCPEAVCWKKVPDTVKELSKKRSEIASNNFNNLIDLKKVLFNIRYKILGCFILPYKLVFEILNPYLKLISIIGIFLITILYKSESKMILLFLITNLMFELIIISVSMLIEEIIFGRIHKKRNYIKTFIYSVFMFFGYKQLVYLWTIIGHINYFKKVKIVDEIEPYKLNNHKKVEEKDLGGIEI